ncbi:unnamed protein product [Rotaria magnacalcarata]|uniref:ZBR-type domain-containing protein n=5 Tax=Rotaria magnacalcarata TaxID=392030 RepID=A0A816QVN6_9BILA|nr:unnamed protein product [Rotaria magnacalcarata]CAF1617556.1 unnamed protein product [Rotaria magnacalcarata]CAF2065286.1 unnamed protein product [Rotaria magnacalcarata]CAF2220370.1 unnamed protein product [Rotaria magnacalcarata]CAF3881326.1 unnamed protein product [Rotaria magnacalcarata]
MSSHVNDENNDSYNDLLQSIMPISSYLDSGYLTLNSPCVTSPSRLSPSSVILNQVDSPLSECDVQSPINAAIRKFVSKIDYEHYISTRKHFDVLTQLYHRNTQHIIDRIFENLSNNDLKCCSSVSRKWCSILRDYHRRKQAKNVKRNLFNSINKTPVKKVQYKAVPMQTITNLLDVKVAIPVIVETTTTEENNLPATPSQQVFTSSPDNTVHLAASTMTFRYGYLKYLHGPTVPKRCPICAYVSIVDVNDQHGICTNPLCRNSFCQCCSGPYHPSSPCKTTTGPIKSPWRQRPTVSPIFSNKTRNNLRRLLI